MREAKMRKRWIWLAPLAVAAVVVFVFVGGEVVRLLWNWLLPPLFGWPAVTFWQALGLLALCRILFGGFGSRGHSAGPRFRRRLAGRMADRMAERCASMTPEERERLLQRMRERWGFSPPPSESKGQ
jgi:hypothetical protein